MFYVQPVVFRGLRIKGDCVGQKTFTAYEIDLTFKSKKSLQNEKEFDKTNNGWFALVTTKFRSRKTHE